MNCAYRLSGAATENDLKMVRISSFLGLITPGDIQKGYLMALWNFLTGLVKPVTELIDEVHTSDEERLQIKARLFEMQSAMAAKVMDYEARVLESKTKIIAAEAQGASWLQRNWRPITMLSFLVLVVADTFGLTEFRLADEAWTLLQIGLGGYVVGRSAEKVIPKITEVMRKD